MFFLTYPLCVCCSGFRLNSIVFPCYSPISFKISKIVLQFHFKFSFRTSNKNKITFSKDRIPPQGQRGIYFLLHLAAILVVFAMQGGGSNPVCMSIVVKEKTKRFLTHLSLLTAGLITIDFLKVSTVLSTRSFLRIEKF